TVCVVGKMRDLILQLSKSSIYSTKPAVDIETENSIKTTLLSTPGVEGIHDLKTRKMGDLVVVDVHLEIDGDLSVKVGHDIAVLARKSVLDNHHVLNVMTHVDPYFKGDNSPGCGGK
ncbi:cation diffusion facilitator family transporter, partial [Enterobacter roggenkampii]